jgi:organic radical activating enzyme
MIVLWMYLGAPTYGEVITLLDQAKLEAVQNHTYVGDILVLKFQQKFPGVSIPTRSYRFLQAAERIAAPSGRYWHPPKHVADVLRKIKPSNDICESILGLNDWLQTTMPSVSQLTKRNLIEVKKNKTMQWFSTVPEQKQKEYVKMAIERKSIVKKSDKEYANAIAVERQSALQKALEKHEMKNERYERMKGELSNVMVLVNWTQLETLVRRITGNMQLKKSKKDKMTLELLKTQLKLRQILIGEPIKFYFNCYWAMPESLRVHFFRLEWVRWLPC